MTSEKRGTVRSRVLKAASIQFNGGTIDCTVKNISFGGAALEVASPLGIPIAFDLVMQTQGLRQRCHVVWRKEKRIGVAFDGVAQSIQAARHNAINADES